MEKVTVRVPASTSNLGPGFDCLGLALRIYNDVTVRRGGRAELHPMIGHAGERFFKAADTKPFRFACSIAGDVPRSRGLGSSVAVRLGTLFGLNELSGRPLTREQLFRICAELEGHPDNAAPATFGGFTVIARQQCQKFEVSPKLHIILLVPDYEVETAAARRLLPRTIKHSSAVANAAGACCIVAAFASGKYEELRGAFGDELHQPFRKTLIPFFDEVVSAAEAAGAFGAFLSGSGSTTAAVALRNADAIAAAMRSAAGGNARTIVTCADNRGARLVRT